MWKLYLSSLFQGILDYIDNLSVSQIRTLFSMISKLTFSTENDSNTATSSVFNDDTYVVIRKQLSSAALKYKRIGIIGSMMIVKNIASVTLLQGEFSENDSERELPDEVYKHVCSEPPPNYLLFLNVYFLYG